jgi:mannosyl-glycoprotein endo-beta-N-acetylglucosaminidase
LVLTLKNFNATSKSGNLVQARHADDLADPKQLFKINYAGEGSFVLESAYNSSTVVDLTNGSTADSTVVRFYNKSNSNAQKWIFIPLGNTVYRNYNITLDQMVNYQKQAGQYPNTSLDTLRSKINPNQAIQAGPYQFVDLRLYTGLTGAQLNTYINTRSNHMLYNRGQAFVEASQTYGLNEAYLLGHCIHETGWGTSNFSKGVYVPAGTYDGRSYPAGTYYNMYGIHAFDANPQMAMRYAASKGWNTPEKAIKGGAEWIARNYIHAGDYAQNTLYDMKWDSVRSNSTYQRGWHQYATGIEWPKRISDYMVDIYNRIGTTPNLQNIIPVYR